MEWRRWIHAVPARLSAILRRRRVEGDLDDELSFHVAMQTQVNLRAGMSAEEARRQARQAIGGMTQAKERSRDVRPLRWAADLVRDVRYAGRSLWRSPAFTLVAVLTLALGIGANTAMFSVLDTYLFRALPYPQPERLVEVFRTAVWNRFLPYSPDNFLDQRAQNTVFEKMAAFTGINPTLVHEGAPAERLQAMSVTLDFFRALGTQPVLGRTFQEGEDAAGANTVVVLSDRFWQTHFGGDPAVVGRTIRLGDDQVTVVGVMPPGFEHPILWGTVDLWRPLTFGGPLSGRNNNYLRVIARLKPGVTLAQAEDGIARLAAEITKVTGMNRNESVRLAPLQDSTVDDIRRKVMWFTFGLAGFVLLIACGNLANLQLVRAAAHAREHSIRAALGAAGARLLRQSLTESLVVAVLGGALSLLLAVAVVRFISQRLFVDLPGAAVTLNMSAFAFAFLCTVVTGLMFGLVPAWLASRADVNDALKEHPRGATSPRRLRHALIVGEVAFAVVLLSGAGLFLRGLQRFAGLDPGWRVDGLLMAQLAAPPRMLFGPPNVTGPLRLALYRQLEERLGTVPGVQQATVSQSSPVWGFGGSGSILIEGQPEPAPGNYPEMFFEAVSPSYFQTFGIRLVAGRLFNTTDTVGQTQVLIINQEMARRFWPNENPIGKRVGRPGPNRNWMEVIGIVNDVGFPGSLGEPRTRLQGFRPITQGAPPAMIVTLRTSMTPEALIDPVRRAVAEIEPNLPLARVQTARSTIAQRMGSVSLLGTLLGAFAVLGVTLAAIGIYGVTSYSVVQRTNEFGIRTALGAQALDVIRLVIAGGMSLIFLGALIGAGGAYAVSRLLSAAIPTLPTRDPVTLVGVTVALVLVGLVACYLPARRATRIDPLAALREF